MSIEIENEIRVLLDELAKSRRAVDCARGELIKIINSYSGSPTELAAVCHLVLLSFAGRLTECTAGAPSLESHLKDLSDSTSWVHSNFSRWVRAGLGGL